MQETGVNVVNHAFQLMIWNVVWLHLGKAGIQGASLLGAVHARLNSIKY